MWRAYHQATKHTPERLRQSSPVLDWANMPNPFRHYDGVPVLDLPAEPPSPPTPASGADFLSQLFFYSAAVSATKVAPSGSTYALRVNPSSGNLHPTEFHLIANNLAAWPDGVYHYRPSQHMVEQRAAGTFPASAPLECILTTIPWREAWKYGPRAYRYCLLDAGHAYQALVLAANGMGCSCQVDDSALPENFGLAPDEWPLLRVAIHAPTGPCAPTPIHWHTGTPNQLSPSPNLPEAIVNIHAATDESASPWRPADPPALDLYGRSFGEVVRARRSALDFVGGSKSISFVQLQALLSVANTHSLYLSLHRIEGLAPGLYRYDGELTLLREGDQRVAAAGLSLGQDLAGNACLAISIVAEIGDDPRAYRHAHFEAGALGHRLYIAAEALGLRATGIGAFYDDRVHEYLGHPPGEVLYHFAIGYPVPDPRLSL